MNKQTAPMKKAKAAAFAVLLGAVQFAMAPVAAQASEWACRNLQTEINSLPRSGGASGGGNTAQAAKYAKAIKAQEAQLAKARSQMRVLRCSGGSVITLGGGNRNAASCQKLNGAVRAMNANLAKLSSQYARLSGGASKGDQRKALQARFRAMGCDKPQGAIIARAEPSSRNGIDAIFGGQKAEAPAQSSKRRREAPKSIDIPGLSYGGDTFRTLCVRTSDGYYFPISFSTTRENFKRDTLACQNLCPGAEVQLFMHRVPEEESEDMKTEDGEPYKAMDYAFAYRRDGGSGHAACKFNAATGFGIVNDGTAGTTGIQGAAQIAKATRPPAARFRCPQPARPLA
ncbi:MAG: DUF2865 domain-containing protein [Phyllobacteriaceae bacterium]|nr:DUF2865 domain-containing protein [Phyllobacteriaceae bacterium]